MDRPIGELEISPLTLLPMKSKVERHWIGYKDQGSGYYSKGNTKYVDLFDFVKARFHEG